MLCRFARKQMQAKAAFIIQLQSCIRRRIARKGFIELRNEARSAHHFKEISYQLENKIVELTQTITGLKEDCKAANDRSTQLEAQIRTWMEKHEKLEKKNKTLESKLQEPTVPQDQWDELKQQKEKVEAEHRISLDKIKTLERDVSQLNQELTSQKNENSRLQKALEEATEKAKSAPDENELVELRSQVSALKAQLAQLINQPRRQQSGASAPTLAPSRSNGTARRLSPSPVKRTESPVEKDAEETEAPKPRPPSRLQSGPSATKIARRYSTLDTVSKGPKSPTDATRPDLPAKMPRPTSIHQFSNLRGPRSNSFSEDIGDHPEEEVSVDDTYIGEYKLNDFYLHRWPGFCMRRKVFRKKSWKVLSQDFECRCLVCRIHHHKKKSFSRRILSACASLRCGSMAVCRNLNGCCLTLWILYRNNVL